MIFRYFLMINYVFISGWSRRPPSPGWAGARQKIPGCPRGGLLGPHGPHMASRPAGNPAFIFRNIISPKQRPKIWQGISPTVCQNASWTHLVVFSRRFYIGRTEGELTIFHQTPISSTDTIDFCSTGHFQVGAKSSFFRGVISGKQSQIVFSTDFWGSWGI